MTYRVLWMGRGRHTVSFHDGAKFHADGSRFFDLRICRTEREARRLVKELRQLGYTEEP